VAIIGIWNAGGGDGIGVDVSFSEAASKGVIYKYWGVNGICVLGDRLAFIYGKTLLALSCAVGETYVDAKDDDIFGNLLDSICDDCAVKTRDFI